jgi:hypothetical protein
VTTPSKTMTGIAYNSAMSGKKIAELSGLEILIFEVEAPKPNAHERLRHLDALKSEEWHDKDGMVVRGWRRMPLRGIVTHPSPTM